MDDSKFNELSEILFIELEDLLDNLGIDMQINDDILIIEFDDNKQIYVNKHHVTKQIWVSSQNKAYHFNFEDNNWISTKDNQEIFVFLSSELSGILGYNVKLK